MATEQPNWDNLGRGEAGCDGGGLLGVAPTPRIGGLAAEGPRILNLSVEAQCTLSRSELLTGHRAIRWRTQTVPIIGGSDGLTRWEKTNAQLLSDPAHAFGMW